MSGSTATENFTMKFDSRAQSSWPLPPSAVFKCRSAKPWVNPELFRIGNSGYYSDSGIMIVGNFAEDKVEFDQQQQNFNTTSEELEAVYAEPVEVYGLPLPNSKLKAVEYSNNPEKGIDTGDYDNTAQPVSNKFTRNGGGCSRKVVLHMNENQRLKSHQKQTSQNDSLNHKKKRSPFPKEKPQTWRMFY